MCLLRADENNNGRILSPVIKILDILKQGHKRYEGVPHRIDNRLFTLSLSESKLLLIYIYQRFTINGTFYYFTLTIKFICLQRWYSNSVSAPIHLDFQFHFPFQHTRCSIFLLISILNIDHNQTTAIVSYELDPKHVMWKFSFGTSLTVCRVYLWTYIANHYYISTWFHRDSNRCAAPWYKHVAILRVLTR